MYYINDKEYKMFSLLLDIFNDRWKLANHLAPIRWG